MTDATICFCFACGAEAAPEPAQTLGYSHAPRFGQALPVRVSGLGERVADGELTSSVACDCGAMLSFAVAAEMAAILRRAMRKERGSSQSRVERASRTQWLRELQSMGIPTDIALTVSGGADEYGEQLQPVEQWRTLTEHMDGKARHLHILGKPGTGKSVAAASLLARAMVGRWVSAGDFCAMSDWDPHREMYLAPSLLVVDDLGCEREKDAYKIDRLVEARHADRKQTVYTSNLEPGQFTRYDPRTRDRWREGTGTLAIVFAKDKKRPQRTKASV